MTTEAEYEQMIKDAQEPTAGAAAEAAFAEFGDPYARPHDERASGDAAFATEPQSKGESKSTKSSK